MRSPWALNVAVTALLAISACETERPSPAPESEPPSVVTGPIVEVEPGGPGGVRGFTVESGDGTFAILIDPHFDYGFALSHLKQHERTGDPVRVELVERDGDLYAGSIVDA
jgi:hypothetical protein